MALPALAEHLRTAHEAQSFAIDGEGKALLNYTLPKHSELRDRTWKANLIGENLVIFMKCNPKEIVCYCRYISTPVHYKVTVETSNASRSYGGWARPIDYSKSDEVTQAQYLSIPATAVWYFTGGNEELHVPVTVEIL
jgi:hypothetical protein